MTYERGGIGSCNPGNEDGDGRREYGSRSPPSQRRRMRRRWRRCRGAIITNFDDSVTRNRAGYSRAVISADIRYSGRRKTGVYRSRDASVVADRRFVARPLARFELSRRVSRARIFTRFFDAAARFYRNCFESVTKRLQRSVYNTLVHAVPTVRCFESLRGCTRGGTGRTAGKCATTVLYRDVERITAA